MMHLLRLSLHLIQMKEFLSARRHGWRRMKLSQGFIKAQGIETSARNARGSGSADGYAS